ncbi:hypothetical protein HZB74_01330 [Candidatus Saccharibacteria bacterium]|nr:hypothetical protein [Candidatus Saccharibacteria bacterium]
MKIFMIGLLVCIVSAVQVNAQGSSSNYRIDESFIGPGGALESSSTNYSVDPGQQSLGNAGGVGESTSTNYGTQSGSTTTSDPRLVCTVNSGSLNLGALSTSVTVTGTASFSVLNYTAYGYNVTILGNPPNNGAHSLNALASNASSATGTEQFGINLKDNSTPDIGAEAVQVPSGSFSFGAAATNYNIADSFRYVSGETIAQAPKSSGQTDYTISYIVNTSIDTPGGSYLGNQTLLCTGTY